MSTVGDALRLMVAGDDEISTFRDGAEQYPVKMRVLESQRRDLEAIGKLTVPSSNGRPGPHRQHRAARARLRPDARCSGYNRQFSVNLSADVAPGHALDEASNDVRAAARPT